MRAEKLARGCRTGLGPRHEVVIYFATCLLTCESRIKFIHARPGRRIEFAGQPLRTSGVMFLMEWLMSESCAIASRTCTVLVPLLRD